MTTEMKLRKGVTVAVRAKADLWRDRTAEDHRAWEASDASKGMNDAGETKLDSPSRYRRADGSTYKVVRSRVSCRKGWNTVGKCCEVEDADGTLWYVKRADVHVVSA